MITLKSIKPKDLGSIKDVAIKDGLLFSKTTPHLVGLYLNEEIIAFAGFKVGKTKAVLKNLFVLKEYRGKGLARQLTEFRISVLKSIGVKKIEANLTKASLNLHLKNGAKVVKRYKNGITKIVYENI